jgi:hypothetical protein
VTRIGAKPVSPDLVVVFLGAGDADACRLLSLLNIENDLCGIRAVTWGAHESEGGI